MQQVGLFLILVLGITWSLGFWLATQAAPTSLSGFLAVFLPQVWAPTVVLLLLVGVSHGARGIRAEVAERLQYRRGSTPWLALAAVTPAVATSSAVAAARFAGDGAAFTPSQAIPFAIGMQSSLARLARSWGGEDFSCHVSELAKGCNRRILVSLDLVAA